MRKKVIFIVAVSMLISSIGFTQTRTNPDISAMKGKSLYHSGRYAAAAQMLEEGLDSTQSKGMVVYYLARTYTHLNRMPEAMKLLDEYLNGVKEGKIKLSPTDKQFLNQNRDLLRALKQRRARNLYRAIRS